ncbi:MAG: MFS transporter [Chloroflexota bacterium]|nr:MFS transporter [Chloroflexota bacterium]
MSRLPVFYGWVLVGTVATLLMATAGARFLYGVVLKPVSEQFGWDRTSLTGAVLINMIALSICQPFTGLLADRLGPKRVLIGGTALIGAMLVPLSYASQLWQIYLLYGLIGAIGFAATSPVNATTLVNRWFLHRRGTALSIATSGTALGQLVVVPVATWTLTLTDWETTYRVLAVILLLVMVPLGIFLLRDSPAYVADETGDRRNVLPRAPSPRFGRRPPGDLAVPFEPPSCSLTSSLKTPEFWLLSHGFLVCGFTMAFANTHFMAYADDMGMHAMMAADVVAVVALFSVIGTILLGLLADRYARPPILALTYALRGVSFLLLFLLPAGPPIFVYAIVLGVSWSATTPLTAAIAADRYGRANLGVIFGTMFTFMNLGFGVGAFLDGVIYDATGHYDLALLINAVLGLSAAAAAALVPWRLTLDGEAGAHSMPDEKGSAAALTAD